MTTFIIIYLVGYMLASWCFINAMVEDEEEVYPQDFALIAIISLLSWIIIAFCVISVVFDIIEERRESK